MRLPRLFSGLVAALFILAACGGESPPATSETATDAPNVAAQPGTAAPASTAPVNPSTDVATSEETAPAQISETDEEAPAEQAAPVATTPTLKLAAVAAPTPASRFQEGVHYRRLSPTQPTNVSPGQVEVVEVFWYGCAACFAIEPKLESWRVKNKPAYAVFERIPATWNTLRSFKWPRVLSGRSART